MKQTLNPATEIKGWQHHDAKAWGALWRSNCKLDGKRSHLIHHQKSSLVALFKTRRKAKKFITLHYGYIKRRPDLRAEPHGWLMPIAVRVKIIPQ